VLEIMDKQLSNSSGNSATAAGRAPNRSVEFVLEQAHTPDKFCSALAKLFAVRPTEVALLRLEKSLLRFLYPDELKTAGAIPISSSSAIAAHTASTKKIEIFNNFAKVKHASIFETVKLARPAEQEPETIEVETEQPSIQKLMSAPVMSEQKLVGVIQICRKGFSLTSAGPDFTDADLKQLKLAASILAKKEFMASSAKT
jgi:transcriptional regulator with GAF, ATPase, and Fis domain